MRGLRHGFAVVGVVALGAVAVPLGAVAVPLTA